jgi:hypothetical protein
MNKHISPTVQEASDLHRALEANTKEDVPILMDSKDTTFLGTTEWKGPKVICTPKKLSLWQRWFGDGRIPTEAHYEDAQEETNVINQIKSVPGHY